MRNLPSLKALRAFEAAARHESLTAAAEELRVTHGAVSQQVKLLEQFFGQRLFSKQGRRLRLSPHARAFGRRPGMLRSPRTCVGSVGRKDTGAGPSRERDAVLCDALAHSATILIPARTSRDRHPPVDLRFRFDPSSGRRV